MVRDVTSSLCLSGHKLDKGWPFVDQKEWSDAKVLGSLTHLNLQAQGLDACEDDEVLARCPNVRVVYLYGNRLVSAGGLGRAAFGPRITHLYLQDNRLTSMAGLGALTSCRRLLLSGNRIARLEGLERCACLTELSLAGQRLGVGGHAGDAGDAGASPTGTGTGTGTGAGAGAEGGPLAPVFTFCPESLEALSRTLETLDLSGNASLDAAVPALGMLTALTKLELRDCGVRETATVVDMLEGLPRLVILDTKGNPLHAEDARARDAFLVASPSCVLLDDKEITDRERVFVERLVARRRRGGGGGQGQGQGQGQAQAARTRPAGPSSPGFSSAAAPSAAEVRSKMIGGRLGLRGDARSTFAFAPAPHDENSNSGRAHPAYADKTVDPRAGSLRGAAPLRRSPNRRPAGGGRPGAGAGAGPGPFM